MARIRSLKPEHKMHRKVGRLSDRAYRLWVGLLTEADDTGRFVADPDQLQATIFPYQRSLSAARVEAALVEVSALGLVRLYEVDGTRYGLFPSWQEHQRVEHPGLGRFPPPNNGFMSPHEDWAIPHESSSLIKDQGSRIKERSKEQGRERRTAGPLDVEPARNGVDQPEGPAPAVGGADQPVRASQAVQPYEIPAGILDALDQARVLGRAAALRRPAFWEAQMAAHRGCKFIVELRKAEAWIAANPSRAPKKAFDRFMQNWFARAAERAREEA